MSFPKEVHVKLVKVRQGESPLYEATMFNEDVTATGCSPKFEEALMRACRHFEFKFTRHHQKIVAEHEAKLLEV